MLTFHGGVLPISGAGVPAVARDGGRPAGARGPSTRRAGRARPPGRFRLCRLRRAAAGSAAACLAVPRNAAPPEPLPAARGA